MSLRYPWLRTIILTITSASACALLAASVSAESDPDVLAAYVLFGQSETGATVPMARVVVAGVEAECPTLKIDGANPPVTKPMKARVNPNPANFPISVCEAVYPSGATASVTGSAFKLPEVKKKIKGVAIFGDSGCKSSQSCEQQSKWPFGILARSAASGSSVPDVVLHMGDYNYRGTPGSIAIAGLAHKVPVYDAGDNATQGLCQIPGGYYGQNSPGSETPDAWESWKSDFFTPAKPLLASAPWIFARGNHELCSRAGTGWFYLLDSNSVLLGKYANQLGCPKTQNDRPIVLSPPYLVELGSLNVVVLDSANACDSGMLHADSYVNQFSLIRSLIANADNDHQTWLQTHRPLWGVDKLDAVGACGPQSDYCYVNQTLQYADVRAPLPASLDLVVSGHMHRFQVVSFSGDHPQQLIVGNSGVALAKTHPKKTKTLLIDGDQATVMGMSEFGYMNIAVKKHSWTGELIGVDTTPLATFDSKKSPIFESN